MFRNVALILVLQLLGACVAPLAAGEPQADDAFLQMSLEDLLDVEVTSVSKRAQPLSDAAAAVFVITADDIARSGATTLPDVLRMVPGLQVARIDASKWAVASRGYNGRYSNKLLVLVDGRSVYTPSFSGVYWEFQDVLLADIERIEIIRGPGSTLWGANAVNGVINVITRHAADCQGGYLSATAGTEDRFLGAVRYGTTLGDGVYLRVHAKGSRRDEQLRPDGSEAHDGWNILSGGFRLDADLGRRDALTIQGDMFDADIDQEVMLGQLTPPYASHVLDKAGAKGQNLLARWRRTFSSTSDLTVQTYFNHCDREEAYSAEHLKEVDLDIHHTFAAGDHDLVWGFGLRRIRDGLLNYPDFDIDKVRWSSLVSAFVQDQVSLCDGDLQLTFGSKFEHNDYTDYEIQPSARLLWRPRPDHRLWASVSRAVRTPARVEREIEILQFVVPPGTPANPGPLPVGIYGVGTEGFESEELLAHELGYRFSRGDLSLDATIFLNAYRNLRTFYDAETIVLPTHIESLQRIVNGGSDRSHGAELAAAWRMHRDWRWDLAYAFFRRDYTDVADELRAVYEAAPRHQVSLRSALRPVRAVSLDVWLRYVDDVKAVSPREGAAMSIDAATTLDLRLGVELGRDADLSLVGQNLLDDRRVEYTPEAFVLHTALQRAVYVRLDWRF